MLVGYNTNVPYKGNLYHIQTEDNGVKNPVIITLLYLKGTILASKKSGYSHLVDTPEYKEKVREMMKEQHKTMMKELIRGVYTEEHVIPEKPEPAAPSVPAAPAVKEKMVEPPLQEEQPKSQISKSLDDILLDFILNKGD